MVYVKDSQTSKVMTIKDYVMQELNQMLAAEGKNVRIVTERPKPRLVTDNVVKLKEEDQ